MSGTPTTGRVQGAARRRLLRALPSPPAGCLQLRLLPDRQPSRRRGPDRADLPAGLSPLRARPARVRGRPLRPWLIRIAHNLAANLYRDRSRRPASPIDDTSGSPTLHTTEDLVEGRDELSPRAGRRATPARRPPRGSDHALRARHGQPRDRARAWVAPTAPPRCSSIAPSSSSRSWWACRQREPAVHGPRDENRDP